LRAVPLRSRPGRTHAMSKVDAAVSASSRAAPHHVVVQESIRRHLRRARYHSQALGPESDPPLHRFTNIF
jgi:hypothetical protein